jgi:hypothetical protein
MTPKPFLLSSLTSIQIWLSHLVDDSLPRSQIRGKNHVVKTFKEILSVVGGTLTMSNISGAISEMPRHTPLASSTKKI